mmetsp:Transcript_10988/g.26507  ORF Transcript_10988/g.26507 Transcript_10988/m.26507 type:complete len:280 (-) Transcript_10988:33-872(-)
MGIFAGKPRKAFDHPGVYDTEDFVRQCFVPTEGIVCTRQNKGYFHSRTMDYMGAPPGDDEAIQLCSYIIHDCTVQDKQCNLNISAKGLEVSLLGCLIFPPEDKLQPQVSKNSLRGPKKPKVKVDPLQQRIQAAEADETRYVLKVEVQCVVRCLAQTGPGAKIARRSLYGEAGEGEESLELGRPREREITGGTSAGLFGGFGGLKFARKATTKKTSTDIGELGGIEGDTENPHSLQVACESIVIDQQGDAMVSSWLPVEDVLEGLQADLNQKLQDNEEVQ